MSDPDRQVGGVHEEHRVGPFRQLRELARAVGTKSPPAGFFAASTGDLELAVVAAFEQQVVAGTEVEPHRRARRLGRRPVSVNRRRAVEVGIGPRQGRLRSLRAPRPSAPVLSNFRPSSSGRSLGSAADQLSRRSKRGIWSSMTVFFAVAGGTHRPWSNPGISIFRRLRRPLISHITPSAGWGPKSPIARASNPPCREAG